jgi:hypothetical protein
MEVLRNLQKRFYSEWLPTANYERVAGANFEIEKENMVILNYGFLLSKMSSQNENN